jgi:hypothetical protein
MNDLPQMLPAPVEVVAVASVLGGLVLAGLGVEVPTSVVALGSGAIAGMVGLLAPSPR